jgi:hypothetical protein
MEAGEIFPSRRCRTGRSALALLAAAALSAVLSAGARADILPATTIDGPNEEVVGFGGAAMAEDGTGGIVYLKRVGGVTHVFVSRYVEGHWQAPIRVDAEQPYAANWARIGAADGGELEVVWATPFATEGGKPVYEMLGSTLASGSQAFGPAMIVDPDIQQATGTSPQLAMSSTGQADVVYRVVEETEGKRSEVPELRPGDVTEQVRVAHFGGERWVRLGAMNRDPGVSMRPPTAENAPQIAIGPTGNAVVAWQEPEITGVARIWARRIFGTTVNYPMAASLPTFGGSPIEEDADGIALSISKLGEAVVAYRQKAGPGSPLPGPRIFLNTLSNGEATSGAEFAGAIVADGSVPGGRSARLGTPSVDIDEREDLRLLYDSNGSPRVVEGTDKGLAGTLALGPAFAGTDPAELPSVSVMNPSGGGLSAWPSADPQGRPAVAVREDFPGGGVQTGLVASPAGGPISEIAVGRSGLGDGIVAFQQGPLGSAAIVAAPVTAPPAQFVAVIPRGWIKPAQARISWEPAPTSDGPLTYTVVLDGRRLATPAGYSMRLDTHGLGSGVHHIQMLATDRSGESTLTSAMTLRIDGVPPSVHVSSAGASVSVSVTDSFSGAQRSAVSVSFGDGSTGHGRLRYRHRYAHAGIYAVVVHVRDKLGNTGTVRRSVQVR